MTGMRAFTFLAIAALSTAVTGGWAALGASEQLAAAPKKSISDTTWIRASNKHADFIVFTETGQSAGSVASQSGRATVRAISGTVLGTDGAQPILHNGCIKVDCEKGNFTVGTRMFAATVPAGASAIIESFPAGWVFRVIALSTPNAQDLVSVKFKATRLPTRLAAGETVHSEGGDHVSSVSKFDAAKFADGEEAPLLTGVSASSTPSRLIAIRGTEFKCMSSGVLAIREGEFLAQSASNLTISGPSGAAEIKKGAFVDVEAYMGDYRIKALSGPGHTSVKTSEQTLTLHPGQELFLTRRVIEDSDLTPADGVGRRRFDRYTLKDGTKAVMSDFSILSFLGVAEHMVSLRKSTNADQKVMSEKLLKTAAAIHALTQASGPYKSTARTTKPKPTKDSTGRSA
jgi:hypothetical protein